MQVVVVHQHELLEYQMVQLSQIPWCLQYFGENFTKTGFSHIFRESYGFRRIACLPKWSVGRPFCFCWKFPAPHFNAGLCKSCAILTCKNRVRKVYTYQSPFGLFVLQSSSTVWCFFQTFLSLWNSPRLENRTVLAHARRESDDGETRCETRNTRHWRRLF